MSVILGVNHMFLYPEAISNAEIHTRTLNELSQCDLVDALDAWVWRENSRSIEEIKILRDCGKVINYNIGDRFGEEISLPSSKTALESQKAFDTIMREINFGLEAGAKKFIFGSGPDDSDDHNGALERYYEFVIKVMERIPSDIQMCLEPTDWNIDKFFLLGRLSETVDFINRVNKSGYNNLGLLLDMCHIPLMYETLDSALNKGKKLLKHIHLGNALIKDTTSPFYGDKHIPWNYPDSEYTEEDGIKFIRMLNEIGYTENHNATVSFEMRPYEGMTALESLKRFADVYNKAMNI